MGHLAHFSVFGLCNVSVTLNNVSVCGKEDYEGISFSSVGPKLISRGTIHAERKKF